MYKRNKFDLNKVINMKICEILFSLINFYVCIYIVRYP